MAASVSLKELEDDPRLFLYTSLTAGSSHIITATSRMETILKANRIPFQAIDTATDTKARQLWQRRAGQRKLPGLVKEGFVIGDLNQVEEWNEFGELKENIGHVPAHNAAAPAGGQVGVQIAATLNTKPAVGGTASKAPVNNASQPQSKFDKTKAIALPGAAEIAERAKAKAEAAKSASKPEAINPVTLTPNPEDKKEPTEKAKDAKDVDKAHPNLDHLSAPASRIQSGTATPAQREEADGVLPLTSATEPTEKSEDSKRAEEAAKTTGEDKEESKPVVGKKADEGLKVHFEKKKPEEVKKEVEIKDDIAEATTKAVEDLKVREKKLEEVKKEDKNDEAEAAAKSVEKLELEEKTDTPKPQQEAAKDEDNAGKSVGD